ncbi:ThiF family adenylyltransferase [Streptomyces sp. BE147]|uniref:HesA/MoeB/ThiF family protein n=1 Tax=unclassified Streptomyces TaxID=2593676 RepID=UPI002E768867|nr:ThiF family adenylyltransferase [Streptomyces sp. BE147]MEE1741516.1 ThiF family adenylyltransferase [Streptomyces sp. BE147]
MTELRTEPQTAARNATDRPPAPEDFYGELTRRNAGVVTGAQQEVLRTATVLIAGCGSIGGAAVVPLARMGVQHFLLADSGEYELNNLNRQHATVRDLGRNKAEVAAERILEVNPHAEVRVFTEGVTAANAAELAGSCQIVVDGVDVTTMSGVRAKFQLHKRAAALRLPLVTGWDMAGALYAQYFDYRRIEKPFKGVITEGDLDRLSTWELIFRMVPLRRIPTEMLAELSPNLENRTYSVPQVAYTAVLFGSIASHMVAKLLAGEEVREEVVLDVHRAVRPAAASSALLFRRPREARRMVQALALHRLRRLLGKKPT